MQEPKNGVVRVRRSALAHAEAEPVQVSVPSNSAASKANVVDVFWRRRWTVLGAVLLALGGAVAYLQKATPIYSSSSRLFVERSGPRILNENQGANTSGNSYFYTQCELIRSTPILAMAAESTALTAGGRAAPKIDNPIGYLRSGLDATVGKNNDIITVSFQSVDPEEAARVVNGVVDAYVTYQSTQKRSTAAEVLKILQKEKDKRDGELSELLKEMLEFKRKNAALSFESEKGNVITQRLSSLSEALTQAQLATIESKAALKAAEQLQDDPERLRQAAPPQIVAAAEGRKVEIGNRLYALQEEMQKDAERGVAVNHPSAKFRITEFSRLRDEFAQETVAAEQRLAANYLASLQQDLSKTEFRAGELQKAFDEQQKSAVNLNVQAAEYAKLDAELKRTERLCEILDSRIKELNITEDVGAMNINILEVGRPEQAPVYPQKPRVFGMALVAGLVLGLGAALLQDTRDQRLRSVEEIQALLGVPVLGIVPHMGTETETVVQRGQMVHLEPVSEIAEAYRTVRTAIYFGVPDTNVKKMLITSPAPGDGKTTSASNIAIAMAMAGQRTVILDCDFRRPSQHKVFETKHEVGLSSVIVGKTDLAAAIQPTGVKDLFILPCGPIPPNPSELLNSQAFADILEKLAREFDHVIIDSPPVMAVADARILAASADLTVLVLRAEKSTRRASEHALESLVGVGANVLGVVVNDVPRGSTGRGYYGAYGYYSYYGYGRNRKERKALRNDDRGVNGADGNGANGNGPNEHDDAQLIARK